MEEFTGPGFFVAKVRKINIKIPHITIETRENTDFIFTRAQNKGRSPGGWC